MANTITLQNSMNYVQAFCGFRALNIGANNEPAITAANTILQAILGAPFTWNWNRGQVSFLTTPNIQDYPTSTASFGWIETGSYVSAATITNTALANNVATYTAVNSFTVGNKVTVIGTANGGGVFNITTQPIISANSTQFTVAITHGNVSSNPDTGTALNGNVFEISNIMNVLGAGNETGTPAFIAPQIDNNAGQITFRILPLPDQIYQATIIFQQRPSLITSPSSTWTPLPDHYSYIYQNGFAALMMAYSSDPRWQMFNARFVGSLLSAAEGLTEDQKNVFSRTWQNFMIEQTSIPTRSQAGIAGMAQI